MSTSTLKFSGFEDGAKTRTEQCNLRCEDLGRGRGVFYELVINRMRGSLGGVKQPVLEIVEKREGTGGQEWKLFRDEMSRFLYENKGKKEIEVVSKRAGETGKVSAFVIPSADGKKLEKIVLKIHPVDGDDAEQTWQVPEDVWTEKY